jgi:hypothetical protein
MSVVACVVVNDGVVLAADSAGTVVSTGQDGKSYGSFVYENANKVFQLHRKMPWGALFWDSIGIGSTSVSNMIKELRDAFMKVPDTLNWTLEQAAAAVKSRLMNEFEIVYGKSPGSQFAGMGCRIAGYSSQAMVPETWCFYLNGDGTCTGPVKQEFIPNIYVNAQYGFAYRLITGVDPALYPAMESAGLPKEFVERTKGVAESLQVGLVHAAMPIKDAIDLAEFIVDATIKMFRFMPGVRIVGGPIEIAAITKYEKFKWVKRKRYYSTELNPPWPEGEQ